MKGKSRMQAEIAEYDRLKRDFGVGFANAAFTGTVKYNGGIRKWSK